MEHPALHTASQANIAEYYKRNGVSIFSTSRPIVPDGASAKTDVQGPLSWLEKMILTSKSPKAKDYAAVRPDTYAAAEELPGLLSRSEVVQRTWRQVSPVQAALDVVERATHDLEAISKRRPGVPVE